MTADATPDRQERSITENSSLTPPLVSRPWEDKCGLIAQELVFGPTESPSPAEVEASAEVAMVRARLASGLGTAVANGARVEDAFVRLRDRTVPGWENCLLALSTDDRLRATGRRLFREVRRALEQHYKFDQPWHPVICALFVLQAHLARALPVTFYLIIKGRYGGGKTSLLNVLGKLGGGLVFENVSVAALARELGHGRLVCIDEFDVRRPADVQPVMDSLVRQGYRRDAAPYARYDATRREVERVPVYGPKALTIRSFLDPALESRGFSISASPAEGEEAFGYVVRNLWSKVGDLPDRVSEWAAEASALWTDDRLQELSCSPELAEKRRAVLEATGANRDSEQVLVALLVAEIAGVNVLSELRSAVELRRASIGTEDAGDLEDVTEAILTASGLAQERLGERPATVRVWFRILKREVNRRREERKDPPISDRRLATVLTQVGVSESWKRKPGNRVGYDLPVDWLRALAGGTPNVPNPPNTTAEDEGVRQVNHVSPRPHEDSRDPDESEVWGDRPNPKVSRALARLGEARYPPPRATGGPGEPSAEALEAARRHALNYPIDYAPHGPEREDQIQRRARELDASWARLHTSLEGERQ